MEAGKDTEFLLGTEKKQELIIAFSAFQEGKELRFSFNNYLRKKNREGYSVLFLADINNLWYLNGVHSLGKEIGDTFRYIKKIISENDIHTTYAVGGSMGGFAAVLFGSILEIDYVLATGVDYYINAPGTYSKKMKMSKSIEDNTDKKYWDLSKFVKNNKITKYILIVGALSAIDSLFALRLKKVNQKVFLYTLNKCAHRVPVGLLNKKCVEVVFNSFFECHCVENKCGLIEGVVHPEEVLEYWYAHAYYGNEHSKKYYKEKLKKYDESGFIHFILSKLYEKDGDMQKANEFLQNAQESFYPYGIDAGNTA